uniref:Lon proteolytic domain-containing protein n=1 Tax=viral metagenome TaxID=1070528 RepID=A0A6C0D515_9ZZZZ
MNRKKEKISISQKPPDLDMTAFIEEKIDYLQEIIRKTILSIKMNNQINIFSNNDTILCISVLTDLYEKTNEITIKLSLVTTPTDTDIIIDSLQKIIDKISMIICGFGTKNIEDLLFISFGSEYKNMKIEDPIIASKYDIIKQLFNPIGYKIVHWKQTKQSSSQNTVICCDKVTETSVSIEDANMFECYDSETSADNFYQKVYGLRIVIQNEKLRKTLVVNGILYDIHTDCFSNKYITERKHNIKTIINDISSNEEDLLNRMLETMTIKDFLIFGNNDMKKKIFAICTEVSRIKQTKLDKIITKFLEMEPYMQRDMLINLLLYDKDNEVQYICYLLYELIDVKSHNSNDSFTIYDSLPWKLKTHFKDVIKSTVKYTNDMIQKYDIHKISLEQQIYALKVNETVKEKAMVKLKELKGKQDDSGSKAKQYLEGLVRIPFGVYREEPILKKIKDLNACFHKTLHNISQIFPELKLNKKEKYTNLEMNRILSILLNYIRGNILNLIETTCNDSHLKQINKIIQYINVIHKARKVPKITITNQTKPRQISKIMTFANKNKLDANADLYDFICNKKPISLTTSITEVTTLASNINTVESTMKEISNILDESIYGHNHAKNQIMKIIGQWMNGEQTGYCFGFEGSPGVGKTSLAKKGLSKCLIDETGVSRPFSFIALGGSCNGSSLEGHGYTYVNSTWGRIIDILMESKCMNPIIYIDELDKVSKTENGKEIIGIFTHLIDQTQNDAFQDKYFSGIDIDLSKALFIFSYNDPEQIDKILLDRIHRIKFENLSVDDKKTIVNNYILPEINKKMGFENIVQISDEIIEYIIVNYTMEPGVRKLKEILFDLYGEINLEILKIDGQINTDFEIPVKVTKENLENKYIKKYNKIHINKIHKNPDIGIINGLWANSLGSGGIIPIQTLFYPSSTFLDLQLTGLQGDVMKESMNVAKSLAWNLTDNEKKSELLKHFELTKCQGLHIHCPEGAVAKDGPSAGAAITTAIYSLFNKIPIKNDIAITGEINLKGEVTAIGGLELKINGGIRAGIRTFLYPISNSRDFLNWKQTYKPNGNLIMPEFIEISTIQDVFKYVFS